MSLTDRQRRRPIRVTSPSRSSSTRRCASAIIRCELAPGERLVIDELARRYEVSIIPVREALRLLQSEGLVVSVAHVGATVAPISRDSVLEVFTLLEGLELVATPRRGRRARRPRISTRSRSSSTRWTRRSQTGAPQRWADLNTRFHLAISRVGAHADAAGDDAARARSLGPRAALSTSRACSCIARARRRPSITNRSGSMRARDLPRARGDHPPAQPERARRVYGLSRRPCAGRAETCSA